MEIAVLSGFNCNYMQPPGACEYNLLLILPLLQDEIPCYYCLLSRLSGVKRHAIFYMLESVKVGAVFAYYLFINVCPALLTALY